MDAGLSVSAAGRSILRMSANPSREGRFYYRPEPIERTALPELLERHRPDGAIISARYRVQTPTADEEEPEGTLVDPFLEAGVPILDDPDTPVLCQPEVLKDRSSTKRIRQMASAQAVELPLDPESLRSAPARDQLVDVTAEAQADSAALAAPYLEFQAVDDPRLDVNLAMAQRLVQIDPDGRSVAFVQVPVKALSDALLVHAAPRYADTGVEQVVLRISGLHAEEATTAEALAYLEGAAAFDEYGLHPIVDSVGRLGPVLVAGPAVGYSAGSVRYRRVPETPLSGVGSGASIGLEAPFAWRQFRRELVGSDLLQACPVDGCKINDAAPSNLDFRDHNIHVFAYLARWATRVGMRGVSDALHASGDPYACAWADALAAMAQRVQAA
jgi:hypothetical protein